MSLLATEYFEPNDVRGQTRAWLKENCLSRSFSTKFYRAKYVVLEQIAWALVKRSKHGLSASLIKEKILTCGKYGQWYRDKKTKDESGRGFYCNERRFHIQCHQRYRRQEAIKAREDFMSLIKAQNLWGFYDPVFTIPEEVRTWLDENNQKKRPVAKDMRMALKKTIKALLGLNTKARGIQPGFYINTHWLSSGDPFKQSLHFHSMILPLVVDRKKNKIVKLGKTIDAGKARDTWKKHLDGVLIKYGLQEFIKPIYNVFMHYIDASFESQVNFVISYNNRSQSDDVLKTIRRVDNKFERFVCLLHDKKRGGFIPCVKTSAQILDALETVMNPPISDRQAYGFMRRLKDYASLLELKENESDYDELDNLEELYPIEIIRRTRFEFDKSKGNVMPITDILIRKRDSFEDFRKIRPDQLRGERACMSRRKRFKPIGTGG